MRGPEPKCETASRASLDCWIVCVTFDDLHAASISYILYVDEVDMGLRCRGSLRRACRRHHSPSRCTAFQIQDVS